jgi:hypothetical protein
MRPIVFRLAWSQDPTCSVLFNIADRLKCFPRPVLRRLRGMSDRTVATEDISP